MDRSHTRPNHLDGASRKHDFCVDPTVSLCTSAGAATELVVPDRKSVV